jgi:hypothetical protein
MKRSRVVLLAAAVVAAVLFLIPTSAALGITSTGKVYTDKTAWARAVSSYLTEDFNDSTLNSGVSVATYDGYIDSRGYWYDHSDPYGDRTDWYFSKPIKAWGGTWNGNLSGLEVYVYTGSIWQYVGLVGPGFWGFVSSTPFTAVSLRPMPGATTGSGFTLDDMVYGYLAYYPGFVDKTFGR